MELTVGTVLEGKVKSITNFGAFIALPDNKTGMVHISEVANAYVSDIRQHLTENQEVKVVVIGNENGKINLSIKRLEPREPRQPREPRENGQRQGGFRQGGSQGHTGAPRQNNQGQRPSAAHPSSLPLPRPQTSSSRRS